MKSAISNRSDPLALPRLKQEVQPSIADQVFDALQQRILTLELPPQTRMSEADVATRMGVSRQPVREAFKRLAKLGFLQIRPQSGTTVSLISEEAVMKARFIRIALEVQTCGAACETITEDGLAALASLIERQAQAMADGDRLGFYTLDDAFHREIAERAGVGYAWDVIAEYKAHMDRVRMLSLDTSSQQAALTEHIAIHDAIAARDPVTAATATKAHLSRILILIERIKAENHRWFTDRPA